MKLLEFIFSGFWVFLGVLMLLVVPLKFIMYMYSRTLRHWTILKWGYPPVHCDADGDFKEIEDKEELD